MSNSNLSAEEKRQLNNARQAAVRNAWKNEKNLVANGLGTRNWSKKEQQELMTRGSVRGYDGHHMKSVSKYPQYAGNAKNIQFLNEKEHLKAHNGNYHSPTNGYYNPENGKMYKFKGNELKSVPRISLSKNTLEKSNTSSRTLKDGKDRCAEFRASLQKTNSSRSNASTKNNSNSNGNKR